MSKHTNDGASRVAMIVVHGVADQQAGDTPRSVVDLLIANPSNLGAYTSIGNDSFTLAVPPLQPSPHAPQRNTAATPTSRERGLDRRGIEKSFRQSVKSDFYRTNWEVDSKANRTSSEVDSEAKTAGAENYSARKTRAARDGFDLGLQRTDYLLAKAYDNHAATEAYDTTVTKLTRHSSLGGAAKTVDVYEMYWADLSRLSGAVPRIVTELFTLVFRFSKLARGTVQAALSAFGKPAGAPASWRCLSVLQTALDWAFVNILALLFAQLGLLALVIVSFSLAVGHEHAVGVVLGAVLATIGALWALYRRKTPIKLALPLVTFSAGIVLLLAPATVSWLLPLVWLALLALAFDGLLRVSDERFPFIRFCGLALGAISLISMVWYLTKYAESLSLELWVRAALFGVEVILKSIKWWWIVGSFLVVVWWAAGWAASRHRGYEGSGSVATARIGLFVSLAAFIVLTMTVWAMASALLKVSVNSSKIDYEPELHWSARTFDGKNAAAAFDSPQNMREAESNLSCTRMAPNAERASNVPPDKLPLDLSCTHKRPAAEELSSAASFLNARYEDSTASFSLVAVLLLFLLFYMLATFFPSVLAELKIIRPRPADGAGDLGRWLTGGYHHLDRAVAVLVAVAGVAAALVGIVFLATEIKALADRLGPLLDWTDPSDGGGGVRTASRELLKPLVFSVAGVAAALTAFGGVLSRYVPGLRAPLDIALDVDNYLREFPRKAIPRARIFSRYAALLDHLARQNYDRIVVVAHSQGTVISAELLRFIDNFPRSASGERRLRDRLPSDIRLVTFGCPLRQLYAARFPSLYRWILKENGGVNGPTADDVGVARWANGFTSGDYVGRWLWSRPADPLGRPTIDTVHPDALGREHAYAPCSPVMPPDAAKMAVLTEAEMCVGFGAHTHYFDIDQKHVAWLIDFHIAT